jgi:hypothetical protein
VTKVERVTNEVRALETLDLGALRDEWRRRFGPPPTMRSRELLAHLLAWRIQEQVLGGLDAATIRMLTSDRLPPARPTFDAGTILRRDWQGRTFEVGVVDGGFEQAGVHYRSLSAVARAITGTRWNGLRFFGLRGDGE